MCFFLVGICRLICEVYVCWVWLFDVCWIVGVVVIMVVSLWGVILVGVVFYCVNCGVGSLGWMLI